MKAAILALISVLAITSIQAQSKGMALLFRMGYSHVVNAGDQLEHMTAGIGGLTDNFYGIGGDAYWKQYKLVMGVDGMVSAHGPKYSGNNYAEPFIAATHVKVGYVLIERSRWFIYPAVGAGAGGAAITSYRMSNNVKEDVHTIYITTPSFDFGINADWMIHTFGNGRGVGAFMMGARAGYRISPSGDNWKRLSTSDGFASLFKSKTFYISVNVGAGNFWFGPAQRTASTH